jgi:hypothetical protein
MGKHQRTTVLTISSALLALAPKCPVCFLAYFGIFGVATASASAYRAWLPPITAVWLALTVAVLALRTDRKRRYGPIALGVAAALGVFAGKFIVASQLMLYAGIGALIIAAGWSAWSRTSAERTSCVQCEPQTRLTEQGSQAGS